MLEKKLVQAQELKDFLSNICCESYSDVDDFRANRHFLETSFPTYSERTECPDTLQWGNVKLGRLPSCLYVDADQQPATSTESSVMPDIEALIDGAQYKSSFASIFQYFQSRCQHHIHKEVNGKRIVPNACRSKSHPTQCKHEAPWTNRVSPEWMKGPLLVCQGIAKQFKLRCSGVRNWLGQTLLLRNEEWVNGTMPGLCVAFAGSNSDVKPNDRLPILEATHEASCTRKRCLVRKHTLKKTTRITQRTQSTTNGYFGGYIGKRQPAGALETRKCMDKLFTLRAKIRGKGQAAQLRAVSGRMITDVEMNSTYRGAVEVFNLARNLHPRDCLFAECIRTFQETTLDGRAWLYRLEASQLVGSFKTECLTTFVPATRRPNVRTDRARANECEIYGYRPLVHPWVHLSAYEFLQRWRAEPLLVPTYYSNRHIQSRTTWTKEGLALIRTREYKTDAVAAKAGVHYTAIEPVGEEYYLFPDEPAQIYSTFRHSWVLVRKKRPQGCTKGRYP